MRRTRPNSGKKNYLETYPALNTMYKGYAFALGYDQRPATCIRLIA